MTQKKEEVLSRAQLTKRFKSLKRKLRDMKEANESLEKKVADQGRMQEKLMHNLRRAMRKLSLKPEDSGS